MASIINISNLSQEDKNALEEIKQGLGITSILDVWEGIHGLILQCEVSMSNSRFDKSTLETLISIERFRWIENDEKILSVGF